MNWKCEFCTIDKGSLRLDMNWKCECCTIDKGSLRLDMVGKTRIARFPRKYSGTRSAPMALLYDLVWPGLTRFDLALLHHVSTVYLCSANNRPLPALPGGLWPLIGWRPNALRRKGHSIVTTPTHYLDYIWKSKKLSVPVWRGWSSASSYSSRKAFETPTASSFYLITTITFNFF